VHTQCSFCTMHHTHSLVHTVLHCTLSSAQCTVSGAPAQLTPVAFRRARTKIVRRQRAGRTWQELEDKQTKRCQCKLAPLAWAAPVECRSLIWKDCSPVVERGRWSSAQEEQTSGSGSGTKWVKNRIK